MIHRHKNLNGLDVHSPISFVYANESERTSAGGFSESDVNKLAKQESDNSVWMLVNNAPTTWTSVGKDGDVVGPESATTDTVVTFDGTTGKLIKSSGKTLPAGTIGDVTGPASSTADGVVTFNGTTGKIVKNSGKTLPAGTIGDVTGPASATADAVVVFNGTTGKIVKNSSKTLPDGTVVGTTDTQTLTNKTMNLDSNTVTVDGTNEVGFRNIPRAYNNQAATWTLANAGKFAGKTTTTARTMTIPSNSSVAFPIGTALTFTNSASSGDMTINITTDTMYLAGEGTTGSRTLAPWGVATALKVDTTVWMISGTGLT
jgi:hypothetical protein